MSNLPATTKPAEKKRDIRDLIQSDAVKNQLAMVLPKHLTPDRMTRVACTAILKTPKLMQCSPESLLQALMLCSQAGLEPDGRNAHLIPFGDKVQVIFDYKGLVALAERNGVQGIYADRVCENDEFNAWVEDGVKKLNHKIDWRKPRGTAYAYYASCRRSDRLDYEVMTKDEVDAIRKRSRAANDGPWVTDYDEMAKKTVLRRMSKRWDLNPEIADVINEDDDTPPPFAPRPGTKPIHSIELPDPFTPAPEPPTETMKSAAQAPEKQTAPAKPAEPQTQSSQSEAKAEAAAGLAPQPPAPAAESPKPSQTSSEVTPEEEEMGKLINQYRLKRDEAKVTDAQVLAYCRGKAKLCGKMVETVGDMLPAKLKLLLDNWEQALPHIQATK